MVAISQKSAAAGISIRPFIQARGEEQLTSHPVSRAVAFVGHFAFLGHVYVDIFVQTRLYMYIHAYTHARACTHILLLAYVCVCV